MYGTLTLTLVIGLIIIGLCVWVINKAYSRKWELHEDEEMESDAN